MWGFQLPLSDILHGISYVTPIHRILPYHGCEFTNTTDGRADPIRASLGCFGLPQALTYAPAAEARDIRVISHDAVLTPLYIVHV